MLNIIDYIIITLGTLLSMYIFLHKESETNRAKIKVSQIVKANCEQERALNIAILFIFWFVLQWATSYWLLLCSLNIQFFVKFHKTTFHVLLPLACTNLPIWTYHFISKCIRAGGVNPIFTKAFTRYFQLINELSINYWNTCISVADAYCAFGIIKKRENRPIIRMLFEKRKLAIAFITRDQSILKYRYLNTKTHQLMGHFGYDKLMYHLRHKEFKSVLEEDFRYNNKKKWSGMERRKKTESSKHIRRIVDFKHLASAVQEGLLE